MFEYHALPHWRNIEFASDLHLDGATPETAAVFTRYLRRTEADAVFLLGDVFEVWIGAEVLDRPGPFADLGAVLKEVGERLTLAFMPGNRDFLLDADTCRRLGLTALPDPTVLVAWGERTVLVHGDAWCLDDTDYQRFRTEVRSAEWQRRFLAQPLEVRERIAGGIRAHSEARKQALGLQAYGDVDAAHAQAQLARAGSHRLIHGHTHRPSDDLWPALDGSGAPDQRHVLSDWDCEGSGAYRAEILRWTAAGVARRQVLADGRTRAAP